MMLRLISALLFTAAGTAAGVMLSQRLAKEREICRETGDLLRSTALQIRHRGADVYELSTGLKESRVLDSLTFLRFLPEKYKFGEDFHEMWRKALDGQRDIPIDERRILSRLGELLGTSDIEGQLSSIALLEDELMTVKERREENYRRRGKLFRSVGVLAGAMTGILVI